MYVELYPTAIASTSTVFQPMGCSAKRRGSAEGATSGFV